MQEAREILGRTPAVLRALLEGLSEAWTECDEGPRTFRPVDVVGHLLHGERTDWMSRVRRILEVGEEQAFDPFDRWGHEPDVERCALDELLREFEHARARNLQELADLELGEADFDRRGEHPELGSVTLGELLATWVVHDLGHLRQICRVMAGRYAEDVGPWRAYLPVLDEGKRRRDGASRVDAP